METLQKRFAEHMYRHPDLEWDQIKNLMNKNQEAIDAHQWMEETGGQPDIVCLDKGIYLCDCSKEEPAERRSICYDAAARISRKKNAPETSAVELAEAHHTELLSEEEYRYLQSQEDFDLKTSCWIKTPAEIREKGGALIMEKRHGTVFLYHNGADSYYGVRGSRVKYKLK